jgi:hypothetical protein
MTFEQPANLNRFIDEFAPTTRSVRWKQFKLLLPMAVFMAIVGFENLGLRAGMRGEFPA